MGVQTIEVQPKECSKKILYTTRLHKKIIVVQTIEGYTKKIFDTNLSGKP